MTDKEFGASGLPSLIISFPLFATLANLELDQIPITRLLIKLKDPFNREEMSHLEKVVKDKIWEDE